MTTLRRHIKPAILITALLLGLGMQPQAIAAQPVSANLTINARVAPVLKVANPVYPENFAVTQPDIERGYVDIEGQSSVQVVTNQTGGVHLSAEVQDGAVAAAVQLRAAAGQAAYQVTAATVHVPLLIRQPHVIRVAYRLILAATAEPGEYRWPVALSFTQ